MSQKEQTSKQSKKQPSGIPAGEPLVNRRVILVATAACLAGGVILFFLGVPSMILSVFLAMAVAGFVYGFLGGFGEVSFKLGSVISAGGGLAALLASMWLINSSLASQMAVDLTRDLTPDATTWFAMSKTEGIPIQLKIKDDKVLVGIPPLDILAENQLNLRYSNGKLKVVSQKTIPGEYAPFYLGQLGIENLRQNNLFNIIIASKASKITRPLPPAMIKEKEVCDLGPKIPFDLSTGKYDRNESEYFLIDKDNTVIHSSEISLRGAEIVKVQDKWYLVGVVALNHELPSDQMYVKFEVRELVAELKP